MEKQSLAVAIAPIYFMEKLKMYQEAGDQSQTSWDKAPQDQKDLAIQQILYVLFHPEWNAEVEHGKTIRQKRAAGWVYGETYSKEDKTDPELLEYSQLPELRRKRDELFISVINRVQAQVDAQQNQS